MPVLKFLCPTTRRLFDSGVRLDEKSAAVSRLSIVRVHCAQCDREHRFLLADGVFDSAKALAAGGTHSVRAKTKRARRSIGKIGYAHFGGTFTAEPVFSQP